MPSAPLEATVEQAVKARAQNNGQSCIAAKRFIVHASVYDAFERLFVAAFEKLKMGDPMQSDTDIGPLAQARAVAILEKQVRTAVAKGARVLSGGRRGAGRGFFFEPTVLADVPTDLDEAIDLANRTPYGLGASIWTRDKAEQQRGIGELQAGQVFVNGIVASQPALPFGGIRDSGYGRELGAAGIREFVNAKSVCIG
jgi:succinate-semialdehyde dehydrogenase/glutarate-semialdehyde dehydrogenase